MDQSNSHNACSRSVSPEAPATHQIASPVSSLPTAQFFKSVSQEGFPEPKAKKAQPWKAHWSGPQPPTDDGKLIVACPKIATYGSNNLGGL